MSRTQPDVRGIGTTLAPTRATELRGETGMVEKPRRSWLPFSPWHFVLMPVAILMRHRAKLRHDDPESAIRFGVFLVSSVAREKLLFAETPHSRVTPVGRRAMRDELVRVLHGYLAGETPR